MHRFSLILRWSLVAMNALWVGFGEKNIKIVMTCKCLTSDWLTALSITVINPIKLPERRERETRETETTDRDRQRQRQRERERERERGLVSRHPWPALPRFPPRPVNEWMNGPGTKDTLATATWAPRKQIAHRGGVVGLCYAGVNNLLIFSSIVEQCTMNSEGNKLLKKNVNLNKWKIN